MVHHRQDISEMNSGRRVTGRIGSRHSCEKPDHPDHMPYPTLSYRLRSAGYDARCDIRGVGRFAGWLEAHTASPESYIGT